MVFDFGFFAALALVLGVKHAFDADHLVAVSNLLVRAKRVEATVGLAGSWAGGHMLTAAAISALVYFFADSFLTKVAARLDILIPAMLILVGLIGLGIEFRRFHLHRHAHAPGGPQHSHLHIHTKPSHQHGAMAGIGVIHGLASNDELLVVLVVGLGASAWWQVFLGVALFSLGVLVGMVVYAIGIHGIVQKSGRAWAAPALNGTFSVLSIAYAVYLLAGGPGLNLLERLV